MSSFLKICCTIILLLLFSNKNYGYVPVVESFTFLDYNAGPENWEAVENDHGEIIFANQFGVVVYNGYTWSKVDIGGEFHVRAFCKDPATGKIFVGGDDIIGYLEFPALSKPVFTSLKQKLPAGLPFSSIWQIEKFQKDIVFQNSEELIVYSGEKIYRIPNNTGVKSMHKVNERLFVSRQNYGIMEYDGVNLNLVPNGDSLKINKFIKLSSFSNGDLLVIDNEHQKFYRYDFKSFQECFSDLKFIAKDWIFTVRKYGDDFIFGTMHSGAYQVTEQGKIVETLHPDKGLISLKIFDIYVDSYKNIWLCSEEGIDMVSTQIPLKKVNPQIGVEGEAENVTVIDSAVYLLSTGGIYKAPYKNVANFKKEKSSFKHWRGTKQPSFFMTKVQHAVYYGNLLGLHRLKDNKVVTLPYRLARCMTAVDPSNDLYLVGFERFLALVQIKNDKPTLIKQFYNFPNITKIIKFGDAFLLQNTTKRISMASFRNNALFEKTLPKTFEENGNNIFSYRSYIVLSNRNGTFVYDDDFKSVEVSSFGLKRDEHIRIFFEDSKSNIWIGTNTKNSNILNQEFRILSEKKCEYEWIVKSCSKLLNDKIKFMKQIDPNIVCMGGYSGFFFIDISSPKLINKNSRLDVTKVEIKDIKGRTVYSLNKEGIFTGTDSTKESFGINHIPAEYSNIYFEVGNNSFLHSKNNEFKYELNGPVNQTIQFANHHSHEFSNLLPGKYTLKFYMRDVFGEDIESKVFIFNIEESWFKSPLFLLIVAIGIVLFISIIFFAQKKIHSVIRIQLESEVKEKNQAIEENNKYLRDSISFAKIIQQAHLSPKSILKPAFENSYIFNKPKDMVGGDFYWANYNYPNLVFAVGDCTGHGVAGGFMTMLAINRLQTLTAEGKTLAPKDILSKLNTLIINALERRHDEYSFADGMDIAVINVDTEFQTLTFAGSKRSVLIQDAEGIKEIKGNYKSLGTPDNDGDYHEFIIKLKKHQRIYMMTDGITDQFGGTENKKLKLRNIKKFLESTFNKSLQEQEQLLKDYLRDWRGDETQIDDMLFVALEV